MIVFELMGSAWGLTVLLLASAVVGCSRSETRNSAPMIVTSSKPPTPVVAASSKAPAAGLPVAAAASAQLPVWDCPLGETQLDLNNCAGADADRANAEMQSVLQQIHTRHAADPLFLKSLDAAQAAWLKYLDAELTARFPHKEPQFYGSVYPMCFAHERANLLLQRTKALKLWLTSHEEGDLCLGSYAPP